MARCGTGAMEKFKRKRFYLGGFDPRGVRFYHQMYCEQAESYARLSGEAVEVSARRSGPASSARWTVTNQDRKSVVEGKSVSVRVGLGGRRIIKKKKHTTPPHHNLSRKCLKNYVQTKR